LGFDLLGSFDNRSPICYGNGYIDIMISTCALYLRVSSDGQSLENQRPDLLKLAQVRGLDVITVYEEKISAAKARPAFERMMADAHRGKYKSLLVWSLDRFGRSMSGNLAAVLELDRIGVQVISVNESWLDTSSPVRSLLVAIFSWVAEQERLRIVQRTKAGQDRARRAGKVIGRPRVLVDLPKALALRASGLSLRAVATKMKVGAGTLHRTP
jgi:putative DNA-invertase from lambdoid prophage Rac